MVSLRKSANEYKPEETKNISELAKVPVDIDIEKYTGKKINEEGLEVPFSYEYIVMKEEKYRIPLQVKKQLKEHLEENPKLNYFRVKKTGTGKQSQYTVIPLSDDAPTVIKKSDDDLEPVDIEDI